MYGATTVTGIINIKYTIIAITGKMQYLHSLILSSLTALVEVAPITAVSFSVKIIANLQVL